MIDDKTIQQWNDQFRNTASEDIIAYFLNYFKNKIAFSTSLGLEDQVITHMISRIDPSTNIFTLDTGRLFPETYDLMDRTVKKLNVKIRIYFPDAGEVEDMVSRKGINLFYDSIENRKECCTIRKIFPLQRALKNTQIWVTGLRESQSENRHNIRKFEFDEKFNIIKYNPLINWNLDKVIRYLDLNNVPQNKLHKQGFASIGCAPCTRAITPDEDLRAGRWWWENSKKECGLHNLNIQKNK